MVLLQHLVRGEGLTAMWRPTTPMLIDPADRVIELQDWQVVDDNGPTTEVSPWS